MTTGDKIDPNKMLYADESDIQVAQRVRMLFRGQLDHEAVCTGARDRIMYLSQQVERLTTEVRVLKGKVTARDGLVNGAKIALNKAAEVNGRLTAEGARKDARIKLIEGAAKAVCDDASYDEERDVCDVAVSPLEHLQNVLDHNRIFPVSGSRKRTQKAVLDWAVRSFGNIAKNRDERAARLAEEAIEVAQVEGVSEDMIAAIARRVYERPPGELWQEIGGVGITLEALAENVGHSLEGDTEREWQRVLSKSQEWWEKKHAAKVAAGTANISPTGDDSNQKSPNV